MILGSSKQDGNGKKNMFEAPQWQYSQLSLWNFGDIPSGKHTKNYEKSPF